MFSVPSVRREKAFVSGPGCNTRRDPTRLLYVLTLSVLSHCRGVYVNSHDDKEYGEMIVRKKTRWWPWAVFIAACRKGNSSQSPGYLPFDHHHCDILVLLPINDFQDVEVLCMYDIIQLVGYALVLRSLGHRHSEENVCSYCGDSDTKFFAYDFENE